MEQKLSQLPAGRQAQVVALVQQHGSMTVQELSQALSASISTVQRDLDLLGRQGHLIRTHGGALAKTQTAAEVRFDERQRDQSQEKARIGQFALSLIEPHQSVYFELFDHSDGRRRSAAYPASPVDGDHP